jgi:hypothetical protein
MPATRRRRPLPPSRPRDLIIDAMRAYGEAISPKTLSRITGMTIGSLAYHVRALHVAGVIKLVDERRVRGAIEHFYQLEDQGYPRDTLVGLQTLCGVLTLPTTDGYPELVELDTEAREELQKLFDMLRPEVKWIVTEAAKRAKQPVQVSETDAG